MRILLIEDNLSQALILKHWLEEHFTAQVVHAEDGEQGLQFAKFGDWNAIISDIEMPKKRGVDILEDLKKSHPYTPILLITAHPKMDYALKAIEQKADALLFKPLSQNIFITEIEKQLSKSQLSIKKYRKRVLAIGAHPDDVEIGIGGTLLRHAQNGDSIMILTLTGGEYGGVKSSRILESEKAAMLLNAELRVGNLKDTAVSEGPETIKLIQKAIHDFAPTHIYTHTFQDGHQDHRNVHRATIVASREIANVFCYQAPSTTIDFRPTLFIEVETFMEGKLAAIAAYESQTAIRDYLKVDLIKATARYWGRFCGYGWVEPLEVIRQRIEA